MAATNRILPPPRAWQKTALAKWAETRRGIVAAVTGAGKTTFALHCIAAWLKDNREGYVCIVVPTTALLDQWYLTLTDEFCVAAVDIATLAGGRRKIGTKRFILAVINTARQLSTIFPHADRALLIVDECHRAGSPENAKALRGKWAATLGLSATPEREYDEGFYEYVAPALGRVIYRYEYPQAFQDGVIVPFDLINIHFDLSEEEGAEYARLSRLIAIRSSRGDGSESEGVEELLRKRARVSWNSALRVPLAVKLILDKRGTKAIVFHESVAAANEILALLQRRGVMATIYHTDLSPLRRRENLRQFRRGFYSCLVCCRALDEGLNVPGASVAVIASGTASSRQRIQRLGRVLRSQSGKGSATVYTLFGTPTERARLEREEKRLEGVALVRWLHASIDRG